MYAQYEKSQLSFSKYWSDSCLKLSTAFNSWPAITNYNLLQNFSRELKIYMCAKILASQFFLWTTGWQILSVVTSCQAVMKKILTSEFWWGDINVGMCQNGVISVRSKKLLKSVGQPDSIERIKVLSSGWVLNSAKGWKIEWEIKRKKECELENRIINQRKK